MERAIFDIRVEIEAPTEAQIWELATKAQTQASKIRIPGVNVRYIQMRPRERSKTFRATMTPRRRKT